MSDYRYTLSRTLRFRFSADESAAVVMLNPSTADEETDDATIRKLMSFARVWSHGHICRLTVVNLFALRSTNPRGLLTHEDPVGIDNDRHILEAVVNASLVVAAWGANASHGKLAGRASHVRDLLTKATYGRGVWCLGRTKDGHPKHPLYLPGNTELVPLT